MSCSEVTAERRQEGSRRVLEEISYGLGLINAPAHNRQQVCNNAEVVKPLNVS